MKREDSPLTERFITPVYEAILKALGVDNTGWIRLSKKDIAVIFDTIAKAQNDYTVGELCREITLSQALGELTIPESNPLLPIQLKKNEVIPHYWYDAETIVPPDHMNVVLVSADENMWFDSYVSSFGWKSSITHKDCHWCKLSIPYPVETKVISNEPRQLTDPHCNVWRLNTEVVPPMG